MATSNTTAFNLNVAELIEEAYERGSNGTREVRTGYEHRTARRSLNLLTIEWASRGINLWTLDSGAISLISGVATYSLPEDTIDVIEHVIRQNEGITATQSDLAINRVSVSTYSSIPNKLVRGRPVQLFIERLAVPQITVWPVPDNDMYVLQYWRLRRIQDSGTGLNTQDIPFRFIPALVAGLAYYISQKIPEGAPIVERLQLEYERQWALAANEDREKASVRFVPHMSRI